MTKAEPMAEIIEFNFTRVDAKKGVYVDEKEELSVDITEGVVWTVDMPSPYVVHHSKGGWTYQARLLPVGMQSYLWSAYVQATLLHQKATA